MVQDEHESRRAEERARRAGAGRLARACLWVALALLAPVALLVAVGPSVAWRLMPVHPVRAAIAPDALAPREAIAQLDALDPTTDDGLAEAARIFSGAIVDHWPARHEVDPAVATTLFEHPPRWAVIQIGHVLPDVLSALVLSRVDLMRIERRDWRSAVMLGVGTDGQRALALARFLREKGVDAWPVVADGRAVCVLGSPEGARALDPASGAIVEGAETAVPAKASSDSARAKRVAASKKSEATVETVAAEVAEMADAFRVGDPWDEPLSAWLAEKSASARLSGLIMADILADACGTPIGVATKREQGRAGAIMVRLGWTKKKRKHDVRWFPPVGGHL
jgi:hypothetical protein